MKNIKLALVGLFVFTFLTIPYLGVKLNSIEDYDLPLLVKQVSPSVVHIEGNDDYGEWSGSGVVISSDGLLLTAGHIVENAIDIKVTIGDKEYEAIDFYKSDVMKKIKDSINETEFEINHFNVTTTGAGGEMIVIDIRKHIKQDDASLGEPIK